MGDYYDHTINAWVKRKILIPAQVRCLCWLSECYCQFQKHTAHLVFCDDPEIFRLCVDHEDINHGDD